MKNRRIFSTFFITLIYFCLTTVSTFAADTEYQELRIGDGFNIFFQNNSKVTVYVTPPDVAETKLTGGHDQETNDSVYVKTRNIWFQCFVDGFSKKLDGKDGFSVKWALSVEGIDNPSALVMNWKVIEAHSVNQWETSFFGPVSGKPYSKAIIEFNGMENSEKLLSFGIGLKMGGKLGIWRQELGGEYSMMSVMRKMGECVAEQLLACKKGKPKS